jgi:flagellar export protein FliJ
MTMAYSFRLQSVLDYRKLIVDRLWQEIASIEARRQDEQARLRDLTSAEAATLAALGERREKGLDGKQVVELAELLDVIQSQISERDSILRSLEHEADDLRRKAEDLDRRMKALEHMRDRQLDEHRLDQQRFERAATSEVAATFLRRQQVRP